MAVVSKFEHTAPAPGPVSETLAVALCTYNRAESMMIVLDSLAGQDSIPRQLVIVDASPGDDTERLVRNYGRLDSLAKSVQYFRVNGPDAGLTRQRNFALRHVTTEIIAFFDDDVILRPDCLRKMQEVVKDHGNGVAGVGSYAENQYLRPTTLWKVRRMLGIVTSLQPGAYDRSGMSIPWSFLPPTEKAVEGDYLPGYGMMWKTAVVREIGFDEGLGGYAQGEDLDFSLRAKRMGKLYLAGAGRLQHMHDQRGRPDYFTLGFMAIYNRYMIHRRGLPDRRTLDVLRFVYSWTLDTVLLLRRLFFPASFIPTLRDIGGRLKAAYAITTGS